MGKYRDKDFKNPKPYIRTKFKTEKLHICKFCGAIGKHFSFQCKDNPKNKQRIRRPRKPIKQESDTAKAKRLATNREWFKLNPPDDNGNWICYLQITPECPIKLENIPNAPNSLQLEHYYSKVRAPELKYSVENLKPACRFCNRLKGSLNGDELNRLGTIKGLV